MVTTDAIDSCYQISLVMPEPVVELELPAVDWLVPLLTKYSPQFLTPTTLPPIRLTDHHILLLEGANPINVRPYRYPHFQK